MTARTSLGAVARLALALALIFWGERAAAAEPIKIGLVHPFTGSLSPVGIEATDGFEHYFEMNGKTVAGREIVILKEDSAGIPAQAMERVRRLVEREGVSLLTGITSSAEAYAVRDYIDAHQVPLVIMGNAGANDITDKRGSRYIFRTSFSNYQDNAPFGPYACTKLGYRQVAVMFSDFVTGYEMSGGFEGSFKKSGCAVAPHMVEKIASDVDQFWQPK
jgi:branched-chain amino acid transport system substrate-binding protein